MTISKMNKCPICSGTVAKGRCLDCGYYLPDEEELRTMSSLYNFDPEDYPDPLKDVPRTEEMYPDPRPAENAAPEYGQYGAAPMQGGYAPNADKAPPQFKSASSPKPPKIEVRRINSGNLAVPPQPMQQPQGGTKFSISAHDVPWGDLILSLIFPLVGIFCGANLIKRSNSAFDDHEKKTKRLFGTICLILGLLRFFGI